MDNLPTAMEWDLIHIICNIVVILLAPGALFLLHRRKSTTYRQPPSPPGWPVFGHLFSLGRLPHRTLAVLKQKYGPVMMLRLGGSGNTMVISTASAAKEFFKNHDAAFADRTITDTMKSHDYHKGSLAIAPYGPYWRFLRRIVNVEMMVSNRIKELEPVRRKCIDQLLDWIREEADVKNGSRSCGIHVNRLLFLTSVNLISNLSLSCDLVDPTSKMGSELFDAMLNLIEWAGTRNVSDLFPILTRFDLQGLRKKTDKDKAKALEIVSGFVKERIMQRQVEEQEGCKRKRNDFLEVLLEFEGSGSKSEPKKMLERDINIFILDVFVATSETSSSTTEWALTELLINPEAMIKAKAEVAMVIRPDRKFEEADSDNLPYLDAVIKETLRLHPPVPFLIPRKATQDANFMGYHIPKDTQVFVNTWAIGRDPEYWEDPLSFKPERFLDSMVDYKGNYFGLIPFGTGRRMCPGIPLASRMLPLFLGSLLHEFDWELDGDYTRETMDMTEKIGMAMRKLHPLKAIPIPKL